MEFQRTEGKLSTDILKEEFGAIRLDIVLRKGNLRTSCIRRVSDNAAVACSKVLFHDEGIKVFDQFHKDILAGGKIGETIQHSGVPHERIESEFSQVRMDPDIISLFGTKRDVCMSRTVEYRIRSLPYASITEFYNPEYANF